MKGKSEEEDSREMRNVDWREKKTVWTALYNWREDRFEHCLV